jgi:WD40 repeat protein
MKKSSYQYILITLALVAPLALPTLIPTQVRAQNVDTLPVLLTLEGSDAVYSPNGLRIVTTRLDKTARMWDASSGKLLNTLDGHKGFVASAIFSPDGSKIVTTSYDNTAKIWDTSSSKLLNTLEGHTSYVHSAVFSPDGSRIVTTSLDNTAKVWDTSSGKLLTTLEGHTSVISSAAYSPDGSKIITGSWDKTAKVWDASSGQLLMTLEGDKYLVNSATYSPDGWRIVTASRDKTARVWYASSGELLMPLEGHTDGISSATYSPDGSRILTASDDNTAKIWDASSGKLLNTLEGHTSYVRFATYSPDGSRILTASVDQTAKVWDALSGQLLKTLERVYSATYSPDGSRIVTNNNNGTVKVWDASSLYLTKLNLSSKTLNTRALENGKLLGSLPLELNTFPTGKHTLTFEALNYLSQTLELDLKPGDNITREITLQPALGDLLITSNPSGARVTLAGKVLGITPLKLEKQPVGKQDYVLDFPKYKPLTQALEVKSGQALEQKITLERLPTVLNITLEPIVSNAILKVNEESKGFMRNGKSTLELDPNKTSIDIQITLPSHTPFVKTVTLEPSSENNLVVTLEARDAIKFPPVAQPVQPVIPVAPIQPPSVPVKPVIPSNIPSVVPSNSINNNISNSGPRSNVYALVMGVSNYFLVAQPLEYAASDAQNFANALASLQEGNISSQNIVTLLDKDVRKLRIDAVFKQFDHLKADDTLLVYFSGHGTTSSDGKPLLAPVDADPTNVLFLENSSLALEELERQASATGAGKIVFILDACYSGAKDSKSLKVAGSKPIGVVRNPLSSERISVLSASGNQEASYESTTLKAGYFTAALLEGMKGKADHDRNGNITLEELYSYARARVSQQVLKDRSASQNPELQNSVDFSMVMGLATTSEPQKKLSELKRAGKISGGQFDVLSDLLEQGKLPSDVTDYLEGRLEEDKFLRRLKTGAIEGVPAQ